MKKRIKILIGSIIFVSAILSIWSGWYATAVAVGIFGFWFAIELFKLANLDLKILCFLILEVILIWLAFSLAYYEMYPKMQDVTLISLQSLFHFSIVPIPSELLESTLFRIFVYLESFVGYLLVISGVGLLFKK